MPLLVHVVVYACLAVFLAAVLFRYRRIRRYPLNLRWEIYPVPHEGARAKHGGSRLEEGDWWSKPHRPDRVAEVRYMLPEMLFIKALFEHNRKLWFRSFPFHFGLYILAAFLVLASVRALIASLGGPVTILPAPLLIVLGLAGFAATLAGALGLLLMRLSDPEMRPFSNGSHYFNLLFIIASLGLLLAGWLGRGLSLAPIQNLLQGLLTFRVTADIGGPLMISGYIATALLIAYIPLTHMSHFFVKWFTWHKIRWDDEPNVRGGRIEKLINDALSRPVTWSAPHIRADGKKTWADIATEEEDT